MSALRPILLLFLLTVLLTPIVISPECLAQTVAVRGTVRDSLTRQPLQSASVVLRQDGAIRHGTASDGDGYFVLPRVELGRYELVITYVGYEPFQGTLEIAGEDLGFLRISLTPVARRLDEVVVEEEMESGTTAVSAGLQVVRPAEIRRVPVLGASGDLAAYLQTMPGIAAQGDRGGQIFIRGGSTDQNLALLDGMPIYQPFHVVSLFSAFPEDIVDHADIYTGAYGAAYSTRISSVMDVRMRNGNKERLAGSVSVAPFLSGIRIEGPIVRDHVSLVASIRQSLVEEITPNLYGQRLPYRFGDRFAKLHAIVGRRHAYTVTALSTDDRGDIAGTLSRFDGVSIPETQDAGAKREVSWSNRVIGGQYRYRAVDVPLFVELQASMSKSENAVGPENAPDRTASILSRDADLIATVFTPVGELRGGARWRRTDLAFRLGGQFQDLEEEDQQVTEVSVFAESVHDFGIPGASMNPGVNVYVLPDRNEVKLEPRLRMTWELPLPRGKHTAHLGLGRYHQLIVGLSDERDVGNVFTAWVPAADSLELPAAWHAVGGWSSRTEHGAGISIEVFLKNFSSLSVPVFEPFPSFTTDLQPADGTAKGVDLRVETGERPFVGEATISGYVGYSLSEVEYRTSTFKYKPPQDRTHQLNATIAIERSQVGLTIQWQYASGFPYTRSAGFDVWEDLTPNTEVAADPGMIRVLYLEPFGGRQPKYERIDVWLHKTVDLGRARATLRAGVVNLLNRKNLFYFDLFTLRRVNQMPLIPSVGFRLEML